MTHSQNGIVQAIFSGLVCLGGIAIWAGDLSASDWPTYLRSNTRIGSTPDNLKFPLHKTWTYSSPAAPETGWAGPDRRVMEGKQLRHRVRFDDAFHVAVVGDRVFFGSSVDHRVYCKNSASGKNVWSFVTGGAVRLAPTVADGRVLFGSDDGYVYCAAAKTGKLIWKRRPAPDEEWNIGRGQMISRWPIRTGVMVEGDIAYFGAGLFPHEDIFLMAVNAADGKVVWKRDEISESDAGRNDLSPQGYLLTEGNMLVIPSGRSLPAVFSRKDGEYFHKRTISWRRDAGGVIGGTRALLADDHIFAAGPHHMLAMDSKTGDVGFGWFEGRQMAVSGGDAYMATGSHVMRVDRAKYAESSQAVHKLRMEIYTLQRSLRSAKDDAAKKIKARVATATKEAEKLAEAGVVWKTASKSDASLIVAGETAFVGGADVIEAFDIATGKQRWQAKVDGEARGLAVANGRLHVSTTAGDIVVYADSTVEPTIVVETPMPVENPYPKDKLTKVYEDAAKGILASTNVKRGFCLIVGGEEGRLAFELAKRSDLHIYAIEPSAKKVQAARDALTAAGYYGHRITFYQGDINDIPYSNYFANLIVSDTHLITGKLPGDSSKIVRHLKPLGGFVCLGHPAEKQNGKTSAAWLSKTELGEQVTLSTKGQWLTLKRGGLPGAGSWGHQYGDAGNTAASEDRRIKGGLGVLWYGDPGPGKMVNRHEGAVGPLAIDGRLFVQGENSIMAYDAYNGQFLWEKKNPGALRSGVFQNQNPGNLVAAEGRLFMMVKNECLEYDADTGEISAKHQLPEGKRSGAHEWGFVAYRDGLLYGTATIRKELAARLRRRGRKTDDSTDAIFAIDVQTGKQLWMYQGKTIVHHTIALGSDRVFFIDSTITSEERAALLRQDKTELQKLKGEAAKIAADRMKKIDARTAVAIDGRSGKLLWSEAVDVTDCSEIGIGGGKLTMIYRDNTLVLCGANANGHYWNQFIKGDFKRRRLVALSASDGRKVWSKDANYRHRPIVIGNQVIAEPWSFDLKTGKQKTRIHPLTGKEVPWSIIRPGHHCGMLTGCDNMLMFRSGYTGFYDLTGDSGTQHFAGHRLGCWINAIPANGLVTIPEASAGCVCLFSIAATITLEPREARRPWTIYSAVGDKTPVEHMRLNFGAPGDRKDEQGRLWLAYPRPAPRKTTSLDLPLTISEKFATGGGFENRFSREVEIGKTETDWLYSCWAEGLTRFELPLLGKGDAPKKYTVRLHFAVVDEDQSPKFEVKMQGKSVLANFDPMAEAGGRGKAVVREFEGIAVTGKLVIELTGQSTDGKSSVLPILSAIEVIK
jgi:outer membrane protein assembly factor BamB